MGRVEPQDVLNVYKDGLLSGVREKIVLADHDNLNALNRAAQGPYKTFKASTENTERLNALEAPIRSVGGKVGSVPSQVSAQVVEKLVSVLQVNDKLLAPINQTLPPQRTYQSPFPAFSNSIPMAQKESGFTSHTAQCWNCQGNHYQVGAHCFQPQIEEREGKFREAQVEIEDFTVKMEGEMTDRTTIDTLPSQEATTKVGRDTPEDNNIIIIIRGLRVMDHGGATLKQVFLRPIQLIL